MFYRPVVAVDDDDLVVVTDGDVTQRRRTRVVVEPGGEGVNQHAACHLAGERESAEHESDAFGLQVARWVQTRLSPPVHLHIYRGTVLTFQVHCLRKKCRIC